MARLVQIEGKMIDLDQMELRQLLELGAYVKEKISDLEKAHKTIKEKVHTELKARGMDRVSFKRDDGLELVGQIVRRQSKRLNRTLLEQQVGSLDDFYDTIESEFCRIDLIDNKTDVPDVPEGQVV